MVSQIIGTGDGVQAVAGVAPGAQVVFYTVSNPAADSQMGDSCKGGGLNRALVRAVNDDARIISISLAVSGMTDMDKGLVAWLQQQGVIIVAGLPNDRKEDLVVGRLLADYSGVVAVGSIDMNGDLPNLDRTQAPERHPRITVRAPGEDLLCQGDRDKRVWEGTRICSGNSYATPITAGMLALLAQKYPDATNNQLLQVLIRHTGPEAHPLGHDEHYGYGIVNLQHMLRTDPTQYPDVNPLLSDTPAWDGDITIADVRNATLHWGLGGESDIGVTPIPDPSPSPGQDVTTQEDASSWGWVVGAAVLVVVLVVLVVVVVVVVLVSRGRRGPGAV